MYNGVLARFACETCVAILESGYDIPEYLKSWWEGHQKWDAEHGRVHKIGTHKDKVDDRLA